MVEEYCVYDNLDGTHHILAICDSSAFILDGCESMDLVSAVRKAIELNEGKWPFIAQEHCSD